VKFVLVIYNDPELYDALPRAETDRMMRGCLTHADELRRDGKLTDSQMLEDAETAKSVRIRNGRLKVTDGPFTEAKEVLGGFPWTRTGCVEIRPVRDIETVRRRVQTGA
jgi:hypothetical protein